MLCARRLQPLKKTTHKKHKIDLFEVLNNISLNNLEYIDKFSDEELKALSMYVVQLWIKGATTNKEVHFLLTNEYVNPYVFELAKHPKLLYKLFCASNGYGEKEYFKFNKKKEISNKKSIELISIAYDMSFNDAKNSVELFNIDDIEELCELSGLDKDETKKVLEEWK